MAESKRYEVTVEPVAKFLADQSDPAKDQYVFTYTIKITNTGDVAAQLLSRLGVVGQQPVLKPGESFEYTSGASIPTNVGTMQGTYQMMAADGKAFDAPIPLFTLSVPRTLH